MTYIICPNCQSTINIPENFKEAEQYLERLRFCPFCGYQDEWEEYQKS